MTRLTYAMTQELLKDPRITDYMGGSVTFPNWIFDTKNYAKVEGSQKGMIVIVQDGAYTAPNDHNTMRFPRIYVDVWVDPTRNADKSVKRDDADERIERIHQLISEHFHTVSMNLGGMPLVWGSEADIAAGKGVYVGGSIRQDEPSYADIANGDGGRMGTVIYGVNLL